MRAQPYEYGSTELIGLELYLMWRARDVDGYAGGKAVIFLSSEKGSTAYIWKINHAYMTAPICHGTNSRSP